MTDFDEEREFTPLEWKAVLVMTAIIAGTVLGTILNWAA